MNAGVLNRAWEALRSGDAAGARDLLLNLTADQPRLAEAQRLLGMSYRVLGAPEEAEAAFKKAIAADRRQPAHHAEYAAFLESEGRNREAERAFRQALSLDRRFAPAASGLAMLLIDQGRAGEAAQVTLPLTVDARASIAIRSVHARALQEAGRLDEAEMAQRAILEREPLNARAHTDLAELLWMRSGDPDAAVAELDRALAEQPTAMVLSLVKARVLAQVGRADEARGLVDACLRERPDDPALLAARARLGGGEAFDDAERALEMRPQDIELIALATQTAISAGKGERASELAGHLLERAPLQQFYIALQATAWRMIGDPRYRELYDYDRTVAVTELATPKGWGSLAGYLADLADGLHGMHVAKAHPFGQSLRGGSQVTILSARHPAVAAVPKALEPPIRQMLERLERNGHPLGLRNTGAWRYTGMWSVRLRQGGRHDDHVHPQGWFSSACYVELPPTPDREGWLKFGEPGLKLSSPLPPEHYVEPKPGRLVLFPSYMWHGTVPFAAEATRLTFAFDFVPS